MNTLAAFDRDRADVTARVSFALSSVLARVALETEQCRRALADAEATSYTDEETGDTAENPEAARLRAKLDALEALNERCILAGGALSAAWAQESRQAETHVSDALRRCGVYLKKLNRIAQTTVTHPFSSALWTAHCTPRPPSTFAWRRTSAFRIY